MSFYVSYIKLHFKQDRIILEHHVPTAARLRLRNIQLELSEKLKTMTKKGKARKEAICDALFQDRKKLCLQLSFYASALTLLKEYAVMFQVYVVH